MMFIFCLSRWSAAKTWYPGGLTENLVLNLSRHLVPRTSQWWQI